MDHPVLLKMPKSNVEDGGNPKSQIWAPIIKQAVFFWISE